MDKEHEARRWWLEYRWYIQQVKKIEYDPQVLSTPHFQVITKFCDKEKLHQMAKQIRRELVAHKNDKTNQLFSLISAAQEYGSPELQAILKEKTKNKRTSRIMGVTYVEEAPYNAAIFSFDEKLKLYANGPIQGRSRGYWRVVEYKRGRVRGEKFFATKKGAEEYAKSYYGPSCDC